LPRPPGLIRCVHTIRTRPTLPYHSPFPSYFLFCPGPLSKPSITPQIPQLQVFNSFDSTMVLSDGRVAYWGPASDSIDYFAKIGRPMPENMNPAEYMLDLVNRDFTDAKEVEAVIDEWVQRGPIVSKAKVLEQPRSFHSTGGPVKHSMICTRLDHTSKGSGFRVREAFTDLHQIGSYIQGFRV
jgi:hypothetical protein